MLNVATPSGFQLLRRDEHPASFLPVYYPLQCPAQSLSFNLHKHTYPVKWPATTQGKSSFPVFLHLLGFQQASSEFQFKIKKSMDVWNPRNGALY